MVGEQCPTINSGAATFPNLPQTLNEIIPVKIVIHDPAALDPPQNEYAFYT
jgi:hypothetical protein